MKTLKERVREDRMVAESGPGEFNADWPDSDPWRVKLRRRVDCKYRTMTVDFYTGQGLREHMDDGPDAEVVMECLLSDAGGVVNTRSFEEWAAEYGYDTDSRKAEKAYRKTREITAKLRKFLGDQFDAYLYETGD